MGNITTRGFEFRDRVPELRRDLDFKVPDLRCPGEKWGTNVLQTKDLQLGAGVLLVRLSEGKTMSYSVQNDRKAISMNARYQDGLRIFKERCTDYDVINSFIYEMFQSGEIILSYPTCVGSILRIADIGCGDGVVTLQLIKQILKVVRGNVVLDVIEPSMDYLSQTLEKLKLLDSSRLKVNPFNQDAEGYFFSGPQKYDLIFSSHSIYFFPLEIMLRAFLFLNKGGYFVVNAMSRKSIMSILKDMFSPSRTISAEDVLEHLQGHNIAHSVVTYGRPSILDMHGIELREGIGYLADETKNLLSLMLQRSIDELVETEYMKARDVILERLHEGKLILDNTILVITNSR